jgi:VanZ family protein
MPFFSDYEHTTFDTLSHVIELVLLYAPLGFVWSRLSTGGRLAVTVGVLLTTLAIAWPVEYLQGWVVGRYPDLTDIGMSLAGGWVGIRVAEVVSRGPKPGAQFSPNQRSQTSSLPGK